MAHQFFPSAAYPLTSSSTAAQPRGFFLVPTSSFSTPQLHFQQFQQPPGLPSPLGDYLAAFTPVSVTPTINTVPNSHHATTVSTPTASVTEMPGCLTSAPWHHPTVMQPTTTEFGAPFGLQPTRPTSTTVSTPTTSMTEIPMCFNGGVWQHTSDFGAPIAMQPLPMPPASAFSHSDLAPPPPLAISSFSPFPAPLYAAGGGQSTTMFGLDPSMGFGQQAPYAALPYGPPSVQPDVRLTQQQQPRRPTPSNGDRPIVSVSVGGVPLAPLAAVPIEPTLRELANPTMPAREPYDLRFSSSKQKKPATVNVPAPAPDQTEARQLIMYYLAPEITDNGLQQLFRRYEGFRDGNVVMDPATGRSKGCANLWFETQEHAMNALMETSGRVLLGKRVKVIFATPQTNPTA